MNKALGWAFLALGLVVLFFGIQSYNSVGSEVKEALTGAPTDKALWLIGIGVVSAVAGLVGVARR